VYWVVPAAIALAAVLSFAALAYLHPFPPLGYGDRRESEVFRDCVDCPDMLPIPPGEVVMGGRPRREHWLSLLGFDVAPRRVAEISQPYAIGRHEVTFAEWDACVADGGCGGYRPPDEGWGRGERPVIHVSWRDAQNYVRWLSRKTGQAYRLPSEAEWEHAARAGTITAYSWGKTPSHHWANYGDEECPPCTGETSGRDRWLNTAPVGQFPPNAFGVHDVHGNVYEWVEDCYVPDPPAGEVGATPLRTEPCEAHPIRGAAWYSNPERVASHYRAHNPPHYRDWVIGFRVARSM